MTRPTSKQRVLPLSQHRYRIKLRAQFCSKSAVAEQRPHSLQAVPNSSRPLLQGLCSCPSVGQAASPGLLISNLIHTELFQATEKCAHLTEGYYPTSGASAALQRLHPLVCFF